MFLTDLLANLPSVVLAAIVLVAVRGLIDLRGLAHLWRVSPLEFRISMVALVGVLMLGILKGVLVAAIASLLFLVAGVARPHVAFLGRIPGTRRFSDLERHPDNEALPGIVVFRPESSLLYFNAEHVGGAVRQRLEAMPDLQLVVCDLSQAPLVDVAGRTCWRTCTGISPSATSTLRIAEAHAGCATCSPEGLEDRIGYLGRHLSVDQAIAEFQESAGCQTPAVPVSG